MFIYILNLLNSSSKEKNDINKPSASEIINDTKYIIQLAGIKKDINCIEIRNKIVEVFNFLNKYNITQKVKIELLNKVIINRDNEWILKHCNTNNNGNESDYSLNLLLNNIIDIENDKSSFRIKSKQLSLWTNNIEKMKNYYEKYFDCKVGKKQFSKSKGLNSCFICFKSGAKLKIINKNGANYKELKNLKEEQAYIAISVGSKERVSLLTEKIKKAGYEITQGTRFNSMESSENFVLDPEGNLIQIII